MSNNFDRDLIKLAELDICASFFVAGGTYLVSSLDTALKLNAEEVTGRAFADTNMIVLGGGLIIVFGRAALQGIQSLRAQKPQPK